MTNQVNQAFEDFVKNEYDKNANLKTENYSQIVYIDDEIELRWMAWQVATKASESEINSLKERVEELQADNERLREALEVCKYDCHTGEVIGIAEKALKATPTQSLAEHDKEVIERCKKIVADDALAISFQSLGAYRSAIIKAINALKGKYD